jgi:hypothetical protein
VEQPKNQSDGAYHLVFAVALLAALVVLGVGAYLAAVPPHEKVLLSDGIFATLIVVVTWPIATGMAAWRRAGEGERAVAMKSLDQRLQHLGELLNTLCQQQLLSDRAKSVAYRNKDRQALRDAIREEMNAKDWDAALVLANDMEREFGYVQEAGALRAEINNNRTEVVRRQVSEAIHVVDQHVQAEQWTQAVREAERLMAIYPNDPDVQQLPAAIENRRQMHKRQLRESLDAAAGRHDFDGALEILRRLDPYLTPAEATGMQEMVRGLLKDRINSIKDQIIKAAHEGNTAEVARLGDIVRTEHPNSRLALEIPDLLESLRSRAAGQLQAQPA